MKAKDASGATQGKSPTQANRNAGDNNAMALNIISTAAVRNSAAGTHQYVTRNAGRGNGPYQTPGEAVGEAGEEVGAAGILGPICTGTFVW